MADIENEDIKTRYTGKKGPRESRQKVTKAQVVDGESVMKEEVAFQEKEQKVEKNAEAKAAKAKAKARNDAVAVGKKKRECRSGGWCVLQEYEAERQRGTRDILPRIFAYFNNIYRRPLW